jgi:hypothetical protein
MTRNRSLVEKLKVRERRRPAKSDTPRVDNFVAQLPALVLDPADLADHNALVRTTVRIREQMIWWAEFARQLERELMQSTPREWKK